ncbi:MAG TPA: rhamnulokinase family protein [Planosporangium sp.]|jgi:rhamnulokinase|nr:rhamnulokinase family protein [Planosporangium sp.]
MKSYAAVDLGASNGRVIVGRVGPSVLRLREVHRFANEPVPLPDGLHWDIVGLYRQVLTGLRAAVGAGARSVGIDSWAVDYGLLDESGALLGLPYHYRDTRTDGVACGVAPADLYRTTGIQHLPFNTVYQLLAESPARLAAASTLLLVPDLVGFWLTGRLGAERTNASTTALYDVATRDWAAPLIERLELRPAMFAPLRDPGSPAGTLLGHTGLDLPLVAVGSHDTASAVVAVPATGEDFAYISCGTWSLVGVELSAPVLTDDSRAANFTNEVGVDGTIRYLRNVMGLWLLQECQRAWAEPDTAALLASATAAPPFAALVDPDDPGFLAPGDMPARIDAYCARTGQPAPRDRAAYVRCLLESLAVAHRWAVRDAVRLSGRAVTVVHLVGGGARNALLCQLTADACGLPVVAGPVEATALGNILVQARADGGPGDLAAIRELVARSQPLRRYEPRGDQAAWDKASALLGRH